MVYNSKMTVSRELKTLKGGVKTQLHSGSYQVEGDLLTQGKQMFNLALKASKRLTVTELFIAIMIDAPWKGTGCKLNY